MNRTLAGLVLGLILGIAGSWYYVHETAGRGAAPTAEQATARRPLFYRNPMNPAVTSPVPASDEMGMSYIPVYADEAASKAERRPLFYRNPMNPTVTSPTPAKDEMGMDYIPVYADGGAGSGDPAGTVSIDPVTEQNIGVRTAAATTRTLAKTVRAVGRVAYDEQGLRRLHPKTEGWIEELYVNETGVAVQKDTILLKLYSPQLVSTQQEYLLALSNREIFAENSYQDIRQGAEALVESARERLVLLDVPEHQIEELEHTREIKKGLHIHSPFRGIVVNIGAREGQFVTAETEIYMIANLSRVWVYAEVYEDDLPWVKVGDTGTMEVAGIPGERFEGKVAYIYPYLESASRTIRVRLEFDNPGLRLKPDMYANVKIRASEQPRAVVVPSEAIVRSGEREIVFVDRGGGKFEPRVVRIGITAEGYTQVLDGVRSGERVVTSSQFMIDSESKLREATAKMVETMAGADAGGATADPAAASRPAAMDHGSMDHDGPLQAQPEQGEVMDAAAHSGHAMP